MNEFSKLIYKPECYHGHNKTDNFFEGWYFKLVDSTGNFVFAVIPGIFKSKNPNKNHAFLQVIDAVGGESHYLKFDTSEFKAEHDKFELSLGKNFFSLSEIRLDINTEKLKLAANIKISDNIPWPITKRSPGVMGWYSYIPIMECNHGVLSFESKLSGSIKVSGNDVNFDNGRAYIEKDWGKNFPSSYVWLQSNHFQGTPENETISFTGSIAKIPWLGTSFKGFIFGFYFQNNLHMFTTYASGKVDYLHVSDNLIEIKLRNKTHSLKVRAERETKGKALYAPFHGDMLERVVENLDGRIDIKLAKLDESVIFEGSGIHAGIEANGKLEEIADRIN